MDDFRYPRRKPTRLRGRDYSRPGWYFVTICTRYHARFFGNVDGNGDWPNDAGLMVEREWQALAARFPRVVFDRFVVMPNHVHGLIGLRYPLPDLPNPSVSEVIGAFKGRTTTEYARNVVECGWEPFEGQLWQKSFYDEIIRSSEHLDNVRRYIKLNPERWSADEHYQR